MLKEMSAIGAGVSIAGLYLGSAAHADPCHRLDQPLKIKLLPWLTSPPIMAYISMQARQRLLVFRRPTTPQTLLFQLQATRLAQNKKPSVLVIGGNPILDQLSQSKPTLRRQ